MAFKLHSRVRETTASTGTGDLVLAGALSGFNAFGDYYSNGDTMLVVVAQSTQWETFLGTYNSGANSISRTTMFESSNADAAVDWGAGTKDIAVTNIALSDLDAATLTAFRGLFGFLASEIAFTPSDSLAADNVQGALEELDAEKQGVSAELSALIVAGAAAMIKPGDIRFSFDAAAYGADYVELDGATITDGANDYPVVAARYPQLVSGADLVLPDMRGRFPRVWAHGSSNDPDRASRTARAGDGQTGDYPGTEQADELESHNHSMFNTATNAAVGGAAFRVTAVGTGTTTLNTGGNETRGINIYVSAWMRLG